MLAVSMGLAQMEQLTSHPVGVLEDLPVLPDQWRSRRSRCRIFPDPLRGSASMKSIDFGVLKLAMRSRVKRMMSAASAADFLAVNKRLI